MKYFDIHVVCDDKNNEGYSIFVEAESKDDAIHKAKNDNLFVSDGDFEDIDYIVEIDKEEYNLATA